MYIYAYIFNRILFKITFPTICCYYLEMQLLYIYVVISFGFSVRITTSFTSSNIFVYSFLIHRPFFPCTVQAGVSGKCSLNSWPQISDEFQGNPTISHSLFHAPRLFHIFFLFKFLRLAPPSACSLNYILS